MLDELLRVGAVVETDNNWFKVLRREYVPEALAPHFLNRIGTSVHDFVQTVEKRQGLKIACLEEIAMTNGWIDKAQVTQTANAMGHSTYADYLRALAL